MSLRSIKPWNRQSTLAKMRYVLQQLEEEIKPSPGEHTRILENSTKSWLCTASRHLTGQTWTFSARNFPPTSQHFNVLHLPLHQWTLIWGSWSIALNSTEPNYIWSFQTAVVVQLWTRRQRVHDRLKCCSWSSKFIWCCDIAGFVLQERTGNLY